ncbi:hypothetical protein V8F44DRAFT_480336, partial [Aspergillus fumigatus]
PTLLNATAGLLTILINIYTAKGGDWSIMALITAIVTGLSLAMSLAMACFYKLGKINVIGQEHDRERHAGLCMVYS